MIVNPQLFSFAKFFVYSKDGIQQKISRDVFDYYRELRQGKCLLFTEKPEEIFLLAENIIEQNRLKAKSFSYQVVFDDDGVLFFNGMKVSSFHLVFEETGNER